MFCFFHRARLQPRKILECLAGEVGGLERAAGHSLGQTVHFRHVWAAKAESTTYQQRLLRRLPHSARASHARCPHTCTPVARAHPIASALDPAARDPGHAQYAGPKRACSARLVEYSLRSFCAPQRAHLARAIPHARRPHAANPHAHHPLRTPASLHAHHTPCSLRGPNGQTLWEHEQYPSLEHAQRASSGICAPS